MVETKNYYEVIEILKKYLKKYLFLPLTDKAMHYLALLIADELKEKNLINEEET